jgi:hypothetical protein
MPKDEFDFDDPMELNGMALLSDEDTTDAMTECFIEEFMRLGYDHKRVLALFRNPHYIGMNMVLQNRGEDYVKNFIAEVFARWGKQVVWSFGSTILLRPDFPEMQRELVVQPSGAKSAAHEQTIALDSTACDPMGAAVPKLNL